MKRESLFLSLIAVALSTGFIGYKMSSSLSETCASILMDDVESLACNGDVTPFDLKDNYLALVNCILPWQQKLKCKPNAGNYCCPNEQKPCSGSAK